MKNLPDYIRELSIRPTKLDSQVDLEIVKQLFEIDKRIIKSMDQVCKDIAEKKAIDYVGAYELIKHNKMKKECFDSKAKSDSLQR